LHENIIITFVYQVTMDDSKDVYCKVEDCRFGNMHTTNYHSCGKCKKLGHGQIECRNNVKRSKLLEASADDIMPEHLWCESKGCTQYWTHVSTAHNCHICHVFHTYQDCPQNIPKLLLRRQENKKLQTEFKLNNKVYSIQCPECRDVSFSTGNTHVIFGLDMECRICCGDGKIIERHSPACKHVISCKDCFDVMKKPVQEPFEINKTNNSKKNLYIYAKYKLNIAVGKVYTKILTFNVDGEMITFYAKRDDVDEDIIVISGDDADNKIMGYSLII